MTNNNGLHGNAPDDSEMALALIDVINDLEFEGGEELFRAPSISFPKVSPALCF